MGGAGGGGVLEPRARRGGPPAAAGGAPLLELSDLPRRPWFEDVSLTVRAGEIVGLFGLLGSGRSELLETLFGLRRPDPGRVCLGGRPVRVGSPGGGGRAGLGPLPPGGPPPSLVFYMCVRGHLL